MKEIEKAFNETTKIVLGAELGKIDDYGGWLGRHVPLPTKGKSVVSGKDVWVQPSLCFLRKEFDKSRIIDIDEIASVNSSPFTEQDLKDADLRGVLRILEPVVYYCGNLRYKNFANLEKTSGAGEVVNVYYSEDVWYKSKNVAYSNLVVFSDNIFGSHMSHYSKYCVNNYNSFNISRGFEVDGCSNCSDVLFCHNSDGLSNCILCFNAKRLKYAVGNVELGKERYFEIRKMLLDHIVNKLKNEKSFETDIFNVGCYGRPK